jgi:hypothetical protein
MASIYASVGELQELPGPYDLNICVAARQSMEVTGALLLQSIVNSSRPAMHMKAVIGLWVGWVCLIYARVVSVQALLKQTGRIKTFASQVWLISEADHDDMTHPHLNARPWMGFGTRVRTCQV